MTTNVVIMRHVVLDREFCIIGFTARAVTVYCNFCADFILYYGDLLVAIYKCEFLINQDLDLL